MEAEGWEVIKAGGSLGTYDLCAMREGVIRLLEVKGTAAGPFHSFGPEKREAIRVAAKRAGGIPELAYWPKRKKLEYLKESEWPASK